MSGKLTIAFIGCGSFAENFVTLFKAHPYVEKVYVCDRIRQRAEEFSRRFGVEIVDSFEDALTNPKINCVANFTQRHLHGPIVLAALRAGKHVYSAVPMASRVEECQEIVDTVRETGLTYMMAETCIYYPSAMFCRERFLSGDFGRFVYSESQYYHDISHFPENFLADRKSAGVPPFFYPTHSTAMSLWAADSFVTEVVAMGYEDQEGDGIYERGVNQWDNIYSNGFALMKLANGGVARVNECRRIGFKSPSSCVSGFYGTGGGYQFMNAQHLFTKKTAKGVDLSDVSDYVNPQEMTAHKHDPDFKQNAANHVWQWNSFAPVQEKERLRLPEAFLGLPNGHMASHQLLVDDFCTAVYRGAEPTVNARLAARFTVPGLLAHESILRGSAPVKMPGFIL